MQTMYLSILENVLVQLIYCPLTALEKQETDNVFVQIALGIFPKFYCVLVVLQSWNNQPQGDNHSRSNGRIMYLSELLDVFVQITQIHLSEIL